MVEVDQTLRGLSLPIRTPLFERLTGKFLKNETAEHIIRRRLIEIVRRADVILCVPVFERHFQFHWFTAALNAKRNNIARIGVSSKQVREFDLAVEWIDVVTVLINLAVCDRGHDVADLESSLHCRRIRFHICNVNAVALALFSGELSQFGISRWEKRKTGRREPTIVLALSFFQKMGDDGRGDGVEQLRA